MKYEFVQVYCSNYASIGSSVRNRASRRIDVANCLSFVENCELLCKHLLFLASNLFIYSFHFQVVHLISSKFEIVHFSICILPLFFCLRSHDAIQFDSFQIYFTIAILLAAFLFLLSFRLKLMKTENAKMPLVR